MAKDGMMDEIEFANAIENSDHDVLLKATARQTRQMTKDMAALRSEIVDAFKNLPCRTGQECSTSISPSFKIKESKPLLYAGVGGGFLTVAISIAYLIKDVIIPLFRG